MKKQNLFLGVFILFLMVSFQNCSKMNFAPAADITSASTNGSNPTPAEGTLATPPSPTPQDIVDLGGTIKDFKCQQFTEISYNPSQVLTIPKRDNNGLCYLVKIISTATFNLSWQNPVTDGDVVSRNHDSGPITHHPFVLGAQETRLILGGERSIKLSGGKNDTANITVDNFILVGIPPSAMKGNPSYYKAYGTSDSTLPGTNSILFKNTEIPVKPFASGGTSTIAPLSLEGLIEINREYSLDVRGLDAGGIGAISDIYILFK